MLHHIQKSILDRLATAEYSRYAEIKPKDLDGNVFGYHLKQLISDKYVFKNVDGSYCLTQKGREYIVRRFENPTDTAHTIFLIVLKNNHRYLLRKRLVQPMLGYTGFIHGEPKPGENIEDTAKSRLLLKTGIETALKICGHALISQYKDDELQSYSHAIILYGQTTEEDIEVSDKTGENFWTDNLTIENILPSCQDILDMINDGEVWLEKSYYFNTTASSPIIS